MGPLSGKEQREYIKLALDQKRKDELHALKLQEQKVSVEKARGKANQELKQKDESHRVKLGAAPLSSIKPMEVTLEAGNEAAQTMAPLQMGAGQDTVPAMLTPGEAIIPKTVAQDPQYKPVIEQMVSEGRDRNQQMKGYNYGTPNVRGYNDGTAGVPPVYDNTLRPNYQPPPPVVTPVGVPNVYVPGALTDAQVIARESSGNPTIKNPSSSATGLYQMTEAARIDAERVNPNLKGKDFADPAVQGEYRNAYKQYLGRNIGSEDPNALNQSWVVGPGGYNKIKAADPNTPLEQILSAEAIAKNPNLRGKTAGSFLADPDPYTVVGDKRRPHSLELPKEEPPVYSTGGKPVYQNGRLMPADPNAPKPEVPKPDIQAMYDTRIASPDSLTAVNPYSPNRAMRAQGNTATVDPSTGQIVNTVTNMPPPVPRKDEAPAADKTDDALLPDVDLNTKAEQAVAAVEPHAARVEEIVKASPDQDTLQKRLLGLFEEIYTTDGKDSMFNRKDLIRFSILAAGGLATGGSVNGSLRYAGLDTLKNSDARQAGQAQAEKELSKARIAASKEGKPDQVKSIRWRGKTFSAIQGADGRYYTVDPSGKRSFYDGAQDSSQWATANREVTSSVENMITPFVGSKEMAGAVSVQTASVIEDMEAAGANIEPQNVAQMARKAVRVAGQPPDEKASPEERQTYMDRVTNAFYTEAAVAIRPSHSKLFYHEGKPLADDAGNARMRTAIQQAPGESMDKKIDNLVGEYKEARDDPNRKAVMERIARAKPGSPPMDVYLIAKSRNFQ